MGEPTRPGEIPDSLGLVDLAELGMRYYDQLYREVFCPGPGHAERGMYCLATLACQTALSERTLHSRWWIACEALGAGKSRGEVAAAIGLDVEELCAGLRSWARNQLRQGLIDDARHAQVLALLGAQPVIDPADHLPTWQLRRLVQLIDALGDPPLSLPERASLIVLAGQDKTTVDNLAAVLRRAREVRS